MAADAARPERPPLLVGLTGGIGSGKSAVARLFREHAVPVLDADQVARQVVEPGEPALQAIAQAFGGTVIGVDGRLDRGALRSIVFADQQARKRLEGITHPAVRERMFAWLAARAAEGVDYAIWEVPLLIEGGLAALVDRVLVVDVPETMQVDRVVLRDGGTEAAARQVLAAQVSRPARLARADDIIDNSGSLQALSERVMALHADYVARAQALRGEPDALKLKPQ